MRIVTILLALVALALALSLGALARNGVLRSDPPGLGARVRLAMTRNVATIGPDSAYPELRPADLAMEPDALLDAVAAASERLGWAVEEGADRSGEVRAAVVTALLRFRDDVSVRAAPGAALGTSSLRAEARARVGRADYGANAAHLRRLLVELGAAVEP